MYVDDDLLRVRDQHDALLSPSSEICLLYPSLTFLVNVKAKKM
jgi:hypothetical protein